MRKTVEAQAEGTACARAPQREEFDQAIAESPASGLIPNLRPSISELTLCPCSGQGAVEHTYNLSYMGEGDGEDHSSRPAQARS
jgi:hypothetical protein